jgi:D-tyrosyl-tRNA(Tyr) deacylase
MKLTLQRIRSAIVKLGGEILYEVGQGLLCFIAVHKNDKPGDAEWIARKALTMFFWDAENGTPWKMGVSDVGGDVVVLVEPGLLADVNTSETPVLDELKDPLGTKQLYDKVVAEMKSGYSAERIKSVEGDGRVDLDFVNDGPVTLNLDSFHRRD